MTNIKWLAIIAPTGILVILVFLWIYQNQQVQFKNQQNNFKLKSMEFDRDFSNAWNGKSVESPDDTDIDQMRHKIKTEELAAQQRNTKQQQRMETLIKGIENHILPTE